MWHCENPQVAGTIVMLKGEWTLTVQRRKEVGKCHFGNHNESIDPGSHDQQRPYRARTITHSHSLRGKVSTCQYDVI